MRMPELGFCPESRIRDCWDSRIRECWDSGIRDYATSQIDNLTKVHYFHHFFLFINEVVRKYVGELRPLYLTTKTLQIFSTRSLELGTSYLYFFLPGAVLKNQGTLNWKNTGKKNKGNNIRKAGADLRGNNDSNLSIVSSGSGWRVCVSRRPRIIKKSPSAFRQGFEP